MSSSPPSFRPRFSPRSYAEFRAAEWAHQPGLRRYCKQCGQKFSLVNTHNVQGWQRTQSAGICEDCDIQLTKGKAA